MKIKLAALVLLTVTIAAMLAGCSDPYSKNLSGLFWFDFAMTPEDVIEYERYVYGNRTYSTEQLPHAVRYDFVPPFTDDNEHRHMYFFDNETGLLTSVRYTDRTKGSDHWHIGDMRSALLNRVRKCDEESNGGALCYTYGSIDGVKCMVTYDGLGETFFVDMRSD